MPKISVGEIQLYCEMTGARPLLLSIHGRGSGWRDGEKQVAFFSEMYRIVAFDVRGHGRSDKPRGRYGIDRFARDAAGLMKGLDFYPAHGVGHSMVGMIAFRMAVRGRILTRLQVCA